MKVSTALTIVQKYIKALKKVKEPINEYVDNQFIIDTFKNIEKCLIQENLITRKTTFNGTEIHIANNISTVFHKDNAITPDEIHNAYQRLRNKDNELRQHIKMFQNL